MSATTEELRALLEHVKAATGADPDIDRELLIIAPYWPAGINAREVIERLSDESIPNCTGSIDVAVDLVERLCLRWRLKLAINARGSFARLQCTISEETRTEGRAEASTAPVAILAAMLCALIAQSQERQP